MENIQTFFVVLFSVFIEKIALVLALACFLVYVVFMQKSKNLSESDWRQIIEKLDFHTSYSKFKVLYVLSFTGLAFGLYRSLHSMDASHAGTYTAIVSAIGLGFALLKQGKNKEDLSNFFVQWKEETLNPDVQ